MGNTLSYHETVCEVSLGNKGSISGVQLDDKSRRYAGVPYALPPTGEYRWRKPRTLPETYTYSSTDGKSYDATKFKAVCPQKAYHVGGAEGGEGAYSEDCLFVNIWTPVRKDGDDRKWPIMLWLHGGWFQMGDPSQEAGMDPTELISTGGLNAIVVAIGYRLNVFGFLSGPDLFEESDGGAAGNFGLWDQRVAAEWVWENIGYFGGDRENITLAGRSAGAYSVEAQMLHEFRKPDERKTLFRRFFMDSNAIPAQPKSLSDTKGQFDELCEYFGIEGTLPGKEKLSRLRQKTAQELVQAIPKLKNHTFRPVTDDIFIHSGMVEYLKSKTFADEFKARKARLLIGEVLNEETLYSTYNSPTEPTLESLRTQVSNYYAPEVTDRALKRYKLPESDCLEEWQKLFGQIISDGQVRAPSRALVNNLVANGVDLRDIWRYQIAYRLSFIDETVAPMSFGVAHAMDKPFWNFSICYGPTLQERMLMKSWIRNLVAFVNDEKDFEFGTKTIDEMKVITPKGAIEVERDQRWEELLEIGETFASSRT
ncbi:Alpha/Beta hydrolase protein [Aspergillus karnatakaensis]|uniref:Alpha/Beta hydrolase protein n=1 Tax=Aspergillus karnatakaensis TaxID=1810916 RepID=UPI003CCDA1CD